MPDHYPSLTVVMPVFNALPYLDEAIASVLGQSHADFRFAIYDDHSTDGSYDAALAWAKRDSRIMVVRGERRLGPTGSSSAAAALAKTEFVARMDADDVWTKDRLEAQLNALRQYPDAVLIGSTFDMIDSNGRLMLKASSGRTGGDHPPIAHPSILYRRAAFEAIGGYRQNTDYFEDRDLYLRMGSYGRFVVVNRPLIHVRFAGQHARLSDDPEGVLGKIDKHYTRRESGETPARFSPMTFYSITNLAMLSSQRPGIIGLMFRKMSFARPLLAITVIAIVVLAEISPKLARKAWQLVSSIRGAFEKSAEPHADIYVWTPTEV